MKTVALVISILTLLSAFACADECTNQLDGYLKGLTTIVESPHLTDDHKNQAQNEINKISQLRSSIEDCDITLQIPALKNTQDGIHAADNLVKGINN